MRTEAAGALLVALGVLVVSCGPGGTRSGPTASDQTTSGPTTVSEATPTTEPTTPSEATGADVESYLVEMSNLDADVQSELSDFECSYNEQFWPGFCSGGFVEEGEEFEPPPEPTEQELFAIQQGLWLGMFEIRLAHADMLGAVSAPEGFKDAHQQYVNSYRAYFTYVRDQVAGFDDLDALGAFFNAIFDPLAQPPPGHVEAFMPLVESCQALEELGSDAGYRTDLGCPTPHPEPQTVSVEIDEDWSATPNPLPVGDGLVLMTITNTGTRNVRPVVIQIFSGDPLDLPFVGGAVDLSRSGVSEPGSGFAEFGLAYPGGEMIFTEGDSKVTDEVPGLAPGQSVEVDVWSDGTIVVLDYRSDEFERGAYVVIERSASP